MPLVVTDVVAVVVSSVNVEVESVASFSVVDIIVVSSVLGKVVKLLVSSNSSGVVFCVVSSTFEVDSIVVFCVVVIDALPVVVEVIFIFIPVVVKSLPSSVPEKVVCFGTLVVLSGILELIVVVVELSDVSVVGCEVIVDVSAVVVCDVVTVDPVVVVVVVVDTVGVVSVDASVEKEVVIPGRIVVGRSDVGGRISMNINKRFDIKLDQ